MHGLQRSNRIQLRFDRLKAALVHSRFVHTTGVVVANLLSHGVSLFGSGRFLKNAAQEDEIVLIQLAVYAP